MLDGPIPLHVRFWACAACGARHHRDVNSAADIFAAGRAERLNAWRDREPRRLAGGSRSRWNRKPQRCRTMRHGLNPRPSHRGARQ
ncbi:hypothetical protein [Actinomadura sp. NBRC 104425]|uniref:hypothetical protein n=1 Tax=Actinomadura sp. NBRC 104425 TaxID=3032204 RepID=UPI0025526408|nr:hypothetical protein [Actinomadura sp. NBRC 104425]